MCVCVKDKAQTSKEQQQLSDDDEDAWMHDDLSLPRPFHFSRLSSLFTTTPTQTTHYAHRSNIIVDSKSR
jgi:hypothetical protein